MDELPMTDDQCDRLVAKVMDKLAAKGCNQYGTMHASDLNPNITEHHSLRRGIVQAAYLLGAIEMQASELERCACVARRWGETHEPHITVNARNAAEKIARGIETPNV